MNCNNLDDLLGKNGAMLFEKQSESETEITSISLIAREAKKGNSFIGVYTPLPFN